MESWQQSVPLGMDTDIRQLRVGFKPAGIVNEYSSAMFDRDTVRM